MAEYYNSANFADYAQLNDSANKNTAFAELDTNGNRNPCETFCVNERCDTRRGQLFKNHEWYWLEGVGAAPLIKPKTLIDCPFCEHAMFSTRKYRIAPEIKKRPDLCFYQKKNKK